MALVKDLGGLIILWDESSGTGRLKVLLLSKHTSLRQGLGCLLKNGNDIDLVGEAASNEEALQQVRELAPDVILMALPCKRLMPRRL